MGYGNPPDEPETGAGSDAPPAVRPLSATAGHVVPTWTSGVTDNALAEYLLRLGDDRLVLGQRLAEWCGHGPILEEDIALANISLDLFGQAALLLKLAGETEGKGRDEDALAFLRDAVEFRNVQLVELPKGDFGFTIARQFLFDAYSELCYAELARSTHAELAGIASKAHKEIRYHLRHSTDWILKLGDGTPESHARVQSAFDDLWRFTGELFESDDVDRAVAEQGIGVDPSTLRPRWRTRVEAVLAEATLRVPNDGVMASGGRRGRHTEYLGHMLAEMQSVARAHPGAQW
ncbi:phenylacetate-CoA oxygenase, PaaI subunit [Gemmatirosa kalamazoonensis]|uniref:Phenylacetate-CoA oxygenase, PaaI subunit n=1 Tax=Gemmatirosa kalamazoonensis TaxID=861299 RepID=W0RP70_9BACT|nr:1,2-phenylacetyl-CoA epoxidase subunit PaaC [Gemmatirosa kalamazoonensis]AHG91253.1 phenylacetate-CoA oxygenase, PaaI subunit [Gemmatirosa kalamazoonensis]